MVLLARCISFKRMYNTAAFSKPTIPCKLSINTAFKVNVPHRNLQSGKKSQSTEPVANLASNHSPNMIPSEFNLATLGKTRPKIEVDGMMLNWDMAGTGDHVLLLLPGVLGKLKKIQFQNLNKN